MWANVILDADSRDYPYYATMNEVLEMILEFTEEARHSQDDVRMGVYLGMAVKSMQTACRMYRDHLTQNRVEMKQGEESK
jgi:type VI protein secretion system component VasK